MFHLNRWNFPKKRPLKLVEPSLLKRSMQRKQKRKVVNSGIAFGIVGLDGRKSGWVVEQNFNGILGSTFDVFCLCVRLFLRFPANVCSDKYV